jgi:Prenyltransferase and squalene oxidase repeat
MSLGSRRRRAPARAALLGALTAVIAGLAAPAASASAAGGPNLARGSAYLVAPANLISGHYYSSFPHTADFGLTIDGAFALAATGDENQTLKRIVAFLADGGKDASGKTVNYWTGIGTRYASGGAIGKEALLAEVVGDNPRHFGGHNLIAALDASVCARATPGTTRCPAAGSFSYASSVFDQALGVLAQLRAGQRAQAAAPVRYLESLQNTDGSFPSLIPGRGQDVDSTAMAVMALHLAAGHTAAADVRSGLAWIASRQDHGGGFPGAGGDSVNSAGLAIQALRLRQASYRPQIAAAETFLARQQNANGGFSAYATGSRASNVRGSTQALGGAVGTSFGTLRRDLSPPAARPARGHWLAYPGLAAIVLVIAGAAGAMLLRRRPRRPGPPHPAGHRADPVGRPRQ